MTWSNVLRRFLSIRRVNLAAVLVYVSVPWLGNATVEGNVPAAPSLSVAASHADEPSDEARWFRLSGAQETAPSRHGSGIPRGVPVDGAAWQHGIACVLALPRPGSWKTNPEQRDAAPKFTHRFTTSLQVPSGSQIRFEPLKERPVLSALSRPRRCGGDPIARPVTIGLAADLPDLISQPAGTPQPAETLAFWAATLGPEVLVDLTYEVTGLRASEDRVDLVYRPLTLEAGWSGGEVLARYGTADLFEMGAAYEDRSARAQARALEAVEAYLEVLENAQDATRAQRLALALGGPQTEGRAVDDIAHPDPATAVARTLRFRAREHGYAIIQIGRIHEGAYETTGPLPLRLSFDDGARYPAGDWLLVHGEFLPPAPEAGDVVAEVRMDWVHRCVQTACAEADQNVMLRMLLAERFGDVSETTVRTIDERSPQWAG